MPKVISYIFVFLFSLITGFVSSHNPMGEANIIYSQAGNIQVNNPGTAQSFYDNLKGKQRDYFIDSSKDFELDVNLLVPEVANVSGRYSAIIFSESDGKEEQIAGLDGGAFDWTEFYDSFGRDYYLKGPEFNKNLPAGKYKIEVYSEKNTGK